MDSALETKRCPKCTEIKPIDQFRLQLVRSRGNKRRRSCWCKKCVSAAVTRATHKKPERYTTYRREYLRENTFHRMYKNMKTTARTRGQELFVSAGDLKALWEKQGGRCYWSGVQMDLGVGMRVNPTFVSVDRLRFDEPYKPDNIVLCCAWANFGRQCTPVEAWIAFLRDKLKVTGLWDTPA